jgi:hypothetical protein
VYMGLGLGLLGAGVGVALELGIGLPVGVCVGAWGEINAWLKVFQHEALVV